MQNSEEKRVEVNQICYISKTLLLMQLKCEWNSDDLEDVAASSRSFLNKLWFYLSVHMSVNNVIFFVCVSTASIGYI